MIKYVSNNVGFVTIEQATLEEAIDYCRNLDLVGLDCEFNSLDVFNATLFLIVLGNQERQYVIDARSVDIRKLNVLNDKTFIGHNIKIDLKILALNGVHFDKVYCTMIAEQRLIMGTSYSASLAATVSRHLKVYMSKEERNSFVTDRPDRLVMHDFMIKYAAKDIEYIEKIKDSQDVFIARYGMEFLIYDIEMPLVSIMARCDLAGFVLNKDKWLGVIESNKKKIGLLEKECDILVYELIKDNRVALQELAPQANQLDMFSTDIKLSINYNSSNQIKTLFRVLGLEVPTVKEKESVGKDVLAEWLLNNPDHVLCPFIEKYTERSKVAKELSTYGESFLSMVKPDGKIHTVFKQCSTDTGRFSSGDSKYGFPNFQNIPRDNKFRHCFGVDEGYEITTSDLSGAELVIMCSLSGDEKLYMLSKGDMHSHFANLCWSKIYESRGLVWDDPISQTNKKGMRTAFKPLTFGTIYGMYPNKAAKALNVTKEEGKIVIDTIRSEIPVVFSMVEKASRFAMDNGYIVHNTRTNSRRWFEPVIEGHKLLTKAKEERPYDIVPNLKWEKTYEEATVEDVMDFKQASECASAARNTKIQGSQADIIKEILVVFDTHVKENDWDMTLLSCIHDEICVKHPIDYHVICPFEGKRVHARHYIETLMRTVANYYLDGVEMGVEAVTEKTWTK